MTSIGSSRPGGTGNGGDDKLGNWPGKGGDDIPGNKNPILTQIDDYEVRYNSGSRPPGIGLSNKGVWIGVLKFVPNGKELPANQMGPLGKETVPFLYYHQEDFENIIDLLRNEKPVYIMYEEIGEESMQGVSTERRKKK